MERHGLNGDCASVRLDQKLLLCSGSPMGYIFILVEGLTFCTLLRCVVSLENIISRPLHNIKIKRPSQAGISIIKVGKGSNIMASRNSGSKVVVAAVSLTVAALGVGTVYLPFIADKDRIRGMDEEGEMYNSERREYERALQQMAEQAGKGRPHVAGAPAGNSMPTSNSMWARMNQQAGAGQK